MFDDDNYLWGYYSEASGESSSNANYSTKEEILKHKNRLRDLTKNGMVSKDQKKEIEDIQQKIENLRSSCWHDWEIVTMFQYPRRYCRRCDKEDLTYNHNAHENK